MAGNVDERLGMVYTFFESYRVTSWVEADEGYIEFSQCIKQSFDLIG